MAAMDDRWLVLVPYLAGRDHVRFGDRWELMPFGDYDGTWPSALIEARARSLVAKHVDALGKPIERPMVLVRDGEVMVAEPATEEGPALRSALHLAVLAKNPAWGPDVDGWWVSTSDNTEILVWPLSEDREYFAHTRGSVVEVRTGGLRYDRDSTVIRAPLELSIGFRFTLDAELADVAFRTLVGEVLLHPPATVEGLADAADWLAAAWRNSPSIPWPARVTFLKTAFEAMLRTRGGWEQAKRVRRRFEALADVDGLRSFDDIVWSPDEAETLCVTVNNASRPATPLQHWYMAFGDHRNATVHALTRPVGPMYEVGTAYDGPLFQTGERVLRDLLRTELTLATGQPLVAGTLSRATHKALQRATPRRASTSEA